MYGLDLFSGIGGITKALDGYVRPVAYCEIDQYARGVLLSRMASGDLPVAPIWDDVTTLHGSMLPPIDIIYGGFPCQDISVAGKQVGLGGKRSGLFYEIVRLAGETRAEWLFLENVSNIRTKGLGRVLKELDAGGYDCRWGLLSAADVGANHKRERWFLLAHAKSAGPGRIERRNEAGIAGAGGGGADMADANRMRELQPQGGIKEQRGRTCNASTDVSYSYDEGQRINLPGGPSQDGSARTSEGSGWWDVEPNVGRVAHGVQKRVDRLRALGNGVVPPQVREAFERLSGIKNFNGDRFTRV